MLALPMAYPEKYGNYSSPPTYSEGARKVKIIRRPEVFNDLNWEKIKEGVVLPVPAGALYQMFKLHEEFYTGKGDSYYHKKNAILDKVYDFYSFYINPETGKKQISIYHHYISRFDFEYIEEKK